MSDKLLMAEKAGLRSDVPPFAPGDTVKVHVKVKEGEKERIQVFQGLVIARKGGGVEGDLHGPQDLPGCRRGAHVPGALSGPRAHRSGAPRTGPPREALLPPRSARQGRPHRREARQLGSTLSAAADRPAGYSRGTMGPGAGRNACDLGSERKRVSALFRIEEERARRRPPVIAGVDEVGRGCLAGPVYAGAVAF